MPRAGGLVGGPGGVGRPQPLPPLTFVPPGVRAAPARLPDPGEGEPGQDLAPAGDAGHRGGDLCRIRRPGPPHSAFPPPGGRHPRPLSEREQERSRPPRSSALSLVKCRSGRSPSVRTRCPMTDDPRMIMDAASHNRLIVDQLRSRPGLSPGCPPISPRTRSGSSRRPWTSCRRSGPRRRLRTRHPGLCHRRDIPPGHGHQPDPGDDRAGPSPPAIRGPRQPGLAGRRRGLDAVRRVVSRWPSPGTASTTSPIRRASSPRWCGSRSPEGGSPSWTCKRRAPSRPRRTIISTGTVPSHVRAFGLDELEGLFDDPGSRA